MEECEEMPVGVKNIRMKIKNENRLTEEHKILTTHEDFKYIKSLNVEINLEISKDLEESESKDDEKLLNVDDLHWLRDTINKLESNNGEKLYFHQIFQGSQLIVPKNKEIVRNPVLEARCKKLKAQQDNRMYKAMTKDVDCERRKHPDDTIAFQLKQMNTHLIAVAQFILSVLAGFAFGFLGVELMIGKLDFGFRLLLGIICSLVIALAELYFLAKKLNEDMDIESRLTEERRQKMKVD